ncbi:MAG: DUF5789 family protein [Halanaeroarchaeum sp.]
MTRTVKPNRIDTVIESLEYPISSEAAREATDDVTLELADGTESMAAVVDRSTQETFETAADLESEIYANLPTEAVGEPGQSEGEG